MNLTKHCKPMESNFDDIYRKHKTNVYNHINRALRNPMISEELTNDVFMKVHSNLTIFDVEKAQMSTWIQTICKRTLIDYYRVHKMNNISFNNANFKDDQKGGFEYFIPATNCTDGEINAVESRKAIYKAMNMLDGKQKEIATLFFMEEKKYSEIAEILDIPLGSVKGTLQRARLLLQDQLKVEYKNC
jgi:RNA polymerase sigma-70 factor, ECF subfamily